MNLCKKIFKYLFLKIKWHRKLKFGLSCNIGINSIFEGMNMIHKNAEFKGELGFGSYIGNNSSLNAKIGKFCSIAPYVSCNAGRHPYTYPYVATAPCFYSLNPTKTQNGASFATEQSFNECVYADPQKKYTNIIGNDCWIGAGVFLIGGVKISDGAVILAHAVVTKDVPPYAIVGGVPAKIIDYRYSKEDIDFLMKIKWWDNSIEWYKSNWKLLTDFDLFKKYYEKYQLDDKTVS